MGCSEEGRFFLAGLYILSTCLPPVLSFFIIIKLCSIIILIILGEVGTR